MPSSVFDAILLNHLWTTEELSRIYSDQNRVQKWYDYEAALALAQANLGVIPEAAAKDIASHADVKNVDLQVIAAEVRRTKHPLVAALSQLQKLCEEKNGEFIHFGPTTQDVLDTGAMLQLKEAHAVFVRDMAEIGKALYRLTEQHRDTTMVGRTHGVQALPITFGFKCATWLSEMQRNHERLRALESRTFVGALVGAVGTKASFGPEAFELEEDLMKRLGLGTAEISWQSSRDRFVEYVSVLGMIGGTLAKIANEIYVLAHNEIDELNEPFSAGKVGSSTMPHKRNPTVVENVVTVCRALRQSVVMLHEGLIQEHERDGRGWKTEWKAVPEACMMTGVILSQMKYVLSDLVVNTDKMRKNVDLLGGFLLSERVMFVLAEKLGKQTAHELVYEVSMHGLETGTPFETVLMESPLVNKALTREELAAALDPTTYVGHAPAIVDRVLASARADGWLT